MLILENELKFCILFLSFTYEGKCRYVQLWKSLLPLHYIHNQKSWEMGVLARYFYQIISLQKTPKLINNLTNGIVVSKIFAGDADTFNVF